MPESRENDIVISSRVRLARNLTDFPFPCTITDEQARSLTGRVASVLSGAGFRITGLEDMSGRDKAMLVEKHIISPEFASSSLPRALASSSDGCVNIMINEEDHLRIQASDAGLCLEKCLERVFEADELLDSQLSYAFSEQLGYLTQCPTNVGTGLRASVMLHLPALTRTGSMRALGSAVTKLGFAVRGLYGEGSEATGAIYQISNQLTLGMNERDIIERLEKAAFSIIERERAVRESIRRQDPAAFSDAAKRALGILALSRKMNSGEAMALLSDLRVGAAAGEINGIGFEAINDLLWEIQPNCMAASVGDSSRESRDEARAALLRRAVKEAVLNEL